MSPRRACAMLVCAGLCAGLGCSAGGPFSAASGPEGGTTDASTPPDAPALPDGGFVTITVDNSGSAGPLSHLSVGSNQLYAVDGMGSAVQELQTLKPSLLRLHVQAIAGALPTSPSAIALCTPSTSTACNQVPWSFKSLDYLVADALTAGAVPLMNIALPPPWQWTITDATSTPHPTGHVTDADDPVHPFAMFAAYMKTLVQYYNLGQATVTQPDGTTQTLVNPSGTLRRIDWWELLNEPSLASPANFYQPPGPYPLTPSFTPAQYVSMWNATTSAMLAADPAIKIVGPALPNIVDTGPAAQYIPMLLQQTRRPDALSFHGYAVVDNAVPDLAAFAGSGSATAGGLANIVKGLHQVQAWTAAAGVPQLPIWLDEFGFNGFGVADPSGRPNGAFGSAWSATAFAVLSTEPALTQLDNFSFALKSLPELSLLNYSSNLQPVLLYWVFQTLGQTFPARGGSPLPVQSSRGAFSVSDPAVSAYARRATATAAVTVLLSNDLIANGTDMGGAGVPTQVLVQVTGGSFGNVSVRSLDTSTNLDSGPTAVMLPAGNVATVTLPGYGVAIVEFAP